MNSSALLLSQQSMISNLTSRYASSRYETTNRPKRMASQTSYKIQMGDRRLEPFIQDGIAITHLHVLAQGRVDDPQFLYAWLKPCPQENKVYLSVGAITQFKADLLSLFRSLDDLPIRREAYLSL